LLLVIIKVCSKGTEKKKQGAETQVAGSPCSLAAPISAVIRDRFENADGPTSTCREALGTAGLIDPAGTGGCWSLEVSAAWVQWHRYRGL